MASQNSPEASYPNEAMLGPNTLELLGVSDPAAIDTITPWHPGGAETYVTDFILSAEGKRQHLIAKACVKFCPRESMEEWMQRRRVLENNQVSVPDVAFVEGATLVEEFIPYSFSEAFAQASTVGRQALRFNFIDMYKRVLGAGFSPTGLHDVRSRGRDAVIIDMGEDLGPPRTITECALSIATDAQRSFDKLTR